VADSVDITFGALPVPGRCLGRITWIPAFTLPTHYHLPHYTCLLRGSTLYYVPVPQFCAHYWQFTATAFCLPPATFFYTVLTRLPVALPFAFTTTAPLHLCCTPVYCYHAVAACGLPGRTVCCTHRDVHGCAYAHTRVTYLHTLPTCLVGFITFWLDVCVPCRCRTPACLPRARRLPVPAPTAPFTVVVLRLRTPLLHHLRFAIPARTHSTLDSSPALPYTRLLVGSGSSSSQFVDYRSDYHCGCDFGCGLRVTWIVVRLPGRQRTVRLPTPYAYRTPYIHLTTHTDSSVPPSFTLDTFWIGLPFLVLPLLCCRIWQRQLRYWFPFLHRTTTVLPVSFTAGRSVYTTVGGNGLPVPAWFGWRQFPTPHHLLLPHRAYGWITCRSGLRFDLKFHFGCYYGCGSACSYLAFYAVTHCPGLVTPATTFTHYTHCLRTHLPSVTYSSLPLVVSVHHTTLRCGYTRSHHHDLRLRTRGRGYYGYYGYAYTGLYRTPRPVHARSGLVTQFTAVRLLPLPLLRCLTFLRLVWLCTGVTHAAYLYARDTRTCYHHHIPPSPALRLQLYCYRYRDVRTCACRYAHVTHAVHGPTFTHCLPYRSAGSVLVLRLHHCVTTPPVYLCLTDGGLRLHHGCHPWLHHGLSLPRVPLLRRARTTAHWFYLPHPHPRCRFTTVYVCAVRLVHCHLPRGSTVRLVVLLHTRTHTFTCRSHRLHATTAPLVYACLPLHCHTWFGSPHCHLHGSPARLRTLPDWRIARFLWFCHRIPLLPVGRRTTLPCPTCVTRFYTGFLQFAAYRARAVPCAAFLAAFTAAHLRLLPFAARLPGSRTIPPDHAVAVGLVLIPCGLRTALPAPLPSFRRRRFSHTCGFTHRTVACWLRALHTFYPSSPPAFTCLPLCLPFMVHTCRLALPPPAVYCPMLPPQFCSSRHLLYALWTVGPCRYSRTDVLTVTTGYYPYLPPYAYLVCLPLPRYLPVVTGHCTYSWLVAVLPFLPFTPVTPDVPTVPFAYHLPRTAYTLPCATPLFVLDDAQLQLARYFWIGSIYGCLLPSSPARSVAGLRLYLPAVPLPSTTYFTVTHHTLDYACTAQPTFPYMVHRGCYLPRQVAVPGPHCPFAPHWPCSLLHTTRFYLCCPLPSAQHRLHYPTTTTAPASAALPDGRRLRYTCVQRVYCTVRMPHARACYAYLHCMPTVTHTLRLRSFRIFCLFLPHTDGSFHLIHWLVLTWTVGHSLHYRIYIHAATRTTYIPTRHHTPPRTCMPVTTTVLITGLPRLLLLCLRYALLYTPTPHRNTDGGRFTHLHHTAYLPRLHALRCTGSLPRLPLIAGPVWFWQLPFTITAGCTGCYTLYLHTRFAYARWIRFTTLPRLPTTRGRALRVPFGFLARTFYYTQFNLLRV